MTPLAETQDSTGAREALAVDAMDRLNLEQALIDFEIANARVVDLTGRVTALTSEVLKLRSELSLLQIRHGQVEAEALAVRTHLDNLRGSIAFRIARGLREIAMKAIRR